MIDSEFYEQYQNDLWWEIRRLGFDPNDPSVEDLVRTTADYFYALGKSYNYEED